MAITGSQALYGSDPPACNPPCYPRTALYFDGMGDRVEIPDDDSLTPYNKISISFWIYNSGGQDAGIYKWARCPEQYYSPGNSRAYFMCIQNSTAKVRLGIYSSTNTYDIIKSNNAVSFNEWHHIAGTFDQGNAVIYIDGQLDNSELLSVSYIMNDVHPFFIGGHWDYCTTPVFSSRLNGVIDEVRVFKRALSADEIQQLYCCGCVDETGLVGYWNFDEGTGQVAYDLSTYGNHGYLGSNPNGSDTADPLWLESDAPKNWFYVDHDGPGDPSPGIPGASVGEPDFSDPCENGSCDHPFDSIQKAVNAAINNIEGCHPTIVVLDGVYTGVGNCDIDPNGLEVTIMSENGPRDCVIDCQYSARAFIFQTGEDGNTIIDGFTIINGYSTERGGAIYCYDSSPVIRNCSITYCYAGNYGGAIGCYLASPVIDNCIIKNNYGHYSTGGIDLDNNSNALVSDCIISDNLCRGTGGGICSVGSLPIIKNCLITGNKGSYSGGATSIFGGNLTFINCTIADNYADNIYGAGGIHCWDADVTVTNSILWDNRGVDDSQIKRYFGNETITVTYSDVQVLDSNGLIADSNWPGTGNMNADPLFAAPYLDDYHLKSSAGRWTYTLETNGDFNNDGIVDELDLVIFAHYWLQSNPADLNGDIAVNFLDYALFTAEWLNEGLDIDADFNGDGIVNRLDLDIFTRYWLQASLAEAAIADLNGDKMVDFIDYAMFSANWRGPGNNVGGYTYIDTEVSPCIDAGDPNSPYLLEPQPNGGRINMGTYGNTTAASKSTN